MKKTNSKFLGFMKRNAVYLVLSLCIIAVGVSVTLMLLNRNVDDQVNVDPDVPTVVDPIVPDDPTVPSDPVIQEPEDEPIVIEPIDVPITFVLPVNGATSIGEYSETMVFNSTLGRFSAHMAIDFFAPEGTEVMAVYGGTVLSVETTLLKGTTVVIDHGDGLTTVYNSLADGDRVAVGQVVKQGDVIGTVSVSNRQESASGAHLHFEVMENGEYIDPAKYLEISEK